jgi:hypothetical protein
MTDSTKAPMKEIIATNHEIAHINHELKLENERLKAPVSDEEWNKVYGTKPPAGITNWFRWALSEIIAARTSPSTTPEEK